MLFMRLPQAGLDSPANKVSVNLTAHAHDGKDVAAFDAALACYRQGDVRSAYEHCLTVLEKSPGFHPAAHLAGVIAFERGHHEVAEDLLRRALASAPDMAGYYCDLALPLRAREKYAEALRVLDKALAIEPGLLPALNIKASLLTYLGHGRAAADTLEALARQQPADASVFLRLGLARRNLGELPDARVNLERAIALKPDLAAAYWVLSGLSAADASSNHIAQMDVLLASARDPQAQLELCFALAKEHEDLQQYERAFEYLRQGNSLRRTQVEYDPEADRELFREIAATFSAEFLARRSGSGCLEAGPVFIVGMPRTGSTLLERILSGHSGVGSAGELQVLEGLVRHEERRTGRAFPRLAETFVDNDFARLGRAYLGKSQPFRDASPLFIDKMPMNFLYVGLIKMILPASRVISIRRDPIDTCFSCYKQLFGSQYRFSYELQELAQYYRLYDGLMRHWRAVLPGQILEVQYENLVSDTEREARRVLDFCGLGWEAACLDFQRAAGAVSTPSAVQVRGAVHGRSVGRWRKYAAQLDPLVKALSVLPSDAS